MPKRSAFGICLALSLALQAGGAAPRSAVLGRRPGRTRIAAARRGIQDAARDLGWRCARREKPEEPDAVL